MTEVQRTIRLGNCVCVFTRRAVGSVNAGRPKKKKKTAPEGSGFVQGVSDGLLGVAAFAY